MICMAMRLILSIFRVFNLFSDNKFVQFLSTGSSFLHITIIHNINVCNNDFHFIPLLYLVSIWILYYCRWWKWQETIFISFVKNKSRGSLYLDWPNDNIFKNNVFDIIQIKCLSKLFVWIEVSKGRHSTDHKGFWTLISRSTEVCKMCCWIGEIHLPIPHPTSPKRKKEILILMQLLSCTISTCGIVNMI